MGSPHAETQQRQLTLELLQLLGCGPGGLLGLRVVVVGPPRVALVLLPLALGEKHLVGGRRRRGKERGGEGRGGEGRGGEKGVIM